MLLTMTDPSVRCIGAHPDCSSVFTRVQWSSSAGRLAAPVLVGSRRTSPVPQVEDGCGDAALGVELGLESELGKDPRGA
jgi:hypothetical protein